MKDHCRTLTGPKTTVALSTLLVITALTVLAPTNLRADSTEPLYRLDSESPLLQPDQLTVYGTVEERSIDLDPAIVPRNPDRLDFTLPGGQSLTSWRETYTEHADDWISWTGSISAKDGSIDETGHVLLSWHGDFLTGKLHLGPEFFLIGPQERGGYKLSRIGPLDVPACALHNPTDSDRESLIRQVTEATGEVPAEVGTKAATRIDLLVFFSEEFIGNPTLEAQARAWARDSVVEANQVFASQNINASYNLVGTIPLSGAQPPGESQVNSNCGPGTPTFPRSNRLSAAISTSRNATREFRS